MKNLKSVISSSVLALGVLFASSFSANAAIIKQDIISDLTDERYGSITVQISNDLLDTGMLNTENGDIITLLSIEMGDLIGGFGLTVTTSITSLDSGNLASGLAAFEVEAFDVSEWIYTFEFESAAGGAFSIVDEFGNDFFDEAFILGAAVVSDLPVAVSAPATIAVFSLAMAGLYGRRKQLS